MVVILIINLVEPRITRKWEHQSRHDRYISLWLCLWDISWLTAHSTVGNTIPRMGSWTELKGRKEKPAALQTPYASFSCPPTFYFPKFSWPPRTTLRTKPLLVHGPLGKAVFIVWLQRHLYWGLWNNRVHLWRAATEAPNWFWGGILE